MTRRPTTARTSPQGPQTVQAPDDDSFWVDLRLLATTDLHMQIQPYDYFRDAPAGNCGLTLLANLIDRARAEVPNTLLFDNGDFLQGNPLGDLALRDEGPAFAVHPMIAAMNHMRYDAATLGNHEFNFGLPVLERTIGPANFPIVLANAVRGLGASPAEDDPYLPPYVLLDRRVTDRDGQAHDLRIGVIGLVTPLITIWDKEHLEGRILARDPVETAQALVPRMRAAGADLVVALHHAGIGSALWVPGMEDAAIPLARLGGIDVQILGHSHRIFPAADYLSHPDVDAVTSRVGEMPAVMPGAYGSHLGQIDLALRLRAGKVEVAQAAVCLHPASSDLPQGAAAQRIASGIRPAHIRTLDHIRRPVGHSDGPIDSYFALVAGDASLALMAEAQGAFVAQALMDGPWRDLPVLSAVAPFRAGGRGGPDNYTDIPAGPLLMRHPAEMIRFPNAVRAVEVSGAELSEWLERSAAVFHHILPGSQNAPLIDPAMPCYNFDVIHGVTYGIDLTVPARYDATGQRLARSRRRIFDLAHQGRPVRPDDRFILATNSYRTSGGGGFPALTRPDPILRVPDLSRDVLIRHIQTAGVIRPARPAVWHFGPLPGASVLFDTGPCAARVIAEGHGPSARSIEPLDMTAEGFLRCRLHL